MRTDDLAAVPIKALMERNTHVDWEALDDVFFGCANQAGEDNRNVARMALLLAGLPVSVPGATLNRLCALGHGCDRHRGARDQGRRDRVCHRRRRGNHVARALRAGQGARAFSRANEIYDTTIGWRFINPLMKQQYGVDSMPETGENVAEDFQISRADQDAFALRSQQRAGAAEGRGLFRHAKSCRSRLPGGKAGPVLVDRDEHPRADTTLEQLCQARSAVPQGRHGHRRQRLRRQRWRGGAASSPRKRR